MITHIYALRDVRSDIYERIFVAPADAAAIRCTKMTMKVEGDPVGIFKDDYSLMHIGILDQKTGKIDSDIRHVCDLSTIEGVYDNV